MTIDMDSETKSMMASELVALNKVNGTTVFSRPRTQEANYSGAAEEGSSPVFL